MAGAAAAPSKYSQKVGRPCFQRQRLHCATSSANGAGACGRQDLEKELEDSIECLRQMGIMLEQHSGAQTEGCYFDKINEVVEHYGRLYAMRGAVRDKVPVRVIEDYLDKGLNPELYTKHRLQEAEQLYQVARSLARVLCPCPACARALRTRLAHAPCARALRTRLAHAPSRASCWDAVLTRRLLGTSTTRGA